MSNSSVPASVSGAGVIKSSDSVGLNRYADADIYWYSCLLQGPFVHPMTTFTKLLTTHLAMLWFPK